MAVKPNIKVSFFLFLFLQLLFVVKFFYDYNTLLAAVALLHNNVHFFCLFNKIYLVLLLHFIKYMFTQINIDYFGEVMDYVHAALSYPSPSLVVLSCERVLYYPSTVKDNSENRANFNETIASKGESNNLT